MVIYLDSGSPLDMEQWEGHVSGWTTNPSLLRKAGVTDYFAFAKSAVISSAGKPLSLEVLSDDIQTMEAQAYKLASLADNVYVKVPVITTKGESTSSLIRRLGIAGVKLNVTAILTEEQIETAARSLIYGPAILSVFAGRIMDTGRDVMPMLAKAVRVKAPDTLLLWASTREVYNVVQAEQARCDVITCSPAILQKLAMRGKDLRELSIETVAQFVRDADGLTI